MLNSISNSIDCNKFFRMQCRFDIIHANETLLYVGKYQPALACFEAAIKLNPQHLDAWNNKAVALAESGNSREALLVLDQALAMAIPNPSVEVKHRMAKIYMNKGNVLFTQGRVEEAITSYNNAIELHKDYATAWTSKGFALDNMGT